MNPLRCIIIGAGISGLALAHRLMVRSRRENRPIELTILDRASEPGGVIRTLNHQPYLLEAGPDNFITTKPEALALAKELGLDDQLISTQTDRRGALVVHRGRLELVPEGFLMMAPSRLGPLLKTPVLSWPAKLRVACEIFLPRRKNVQDESLASFVRRRFGREALDRLAQPLLAGIYTADAETLSLRATMPMFLDLEAEYGSVIRGLRRRQGVHGQERGARYSLFVSFRNGMTAMIEKLTQSIGPERFRYGQTVQALRHLPDQQWSVELATGEKLSAHAVALCLPAPHAGNLLEQAEPELARQLKALQYAGAAIVNLAFEKSAMSRPLEAFGFVCPLVENRDVLAGSFSNHKYAGRAPDDKLLLRFFLGGAVRADLLEKSDEQLLDLACTEARQLLGLRGTPLFTHLQRWPDSMPQYTVGHLDRIQAIREAESRVPGLFLAGNAYEGVGIPDCIKSAERAAESLWKST